MQRSVGFGACVVFPAGDDEQAEHETVPVKLS